jgi:hypothetical protein
LIDNYLRLQIERGFNLAREDLFENLGQQLYLLGGDIINNFSNPIYHYKEERDFRYYCVALPRRRGDVEGDPSYEDLKRGIKKGEKLDTSWFWNKELRANRGNFFWVSNPHNRVLSNIDLWTMIGKKCDFHETDELVEFEIMPKLLKIPTVFDSEFCESFRPMHRQDKWGESLNLYSYDYRGFPEAVAESIPVWHANISFKGEFGSNKYKNKKSNGIKY